MTSTNPNFVSGIRRKILQVALDVFRDNNYFLDVGARYPGYQLPDPTNVPSVYLARSNESPAWRTNKEAETDFPWSAFGFIFAEKDVELAKVDLQDQMELTIISLMTNTTFTAIADLVEINFIDPGPLALTQFGVEVEIQPPMGVIRMDVRTQFLYVRI